MGTTTYNLLFGIFVRGQQIDRLHMTKIDVMAQQKYE